MVHEQGEHHRGAPYSSSIIALISMLQTAVQLFDGGATALYPDAPGCVLLLGYLARVL